MSAATDFAAATAARIKAAAPARFRITTDVASFTPPGVLVIPVPTRRTYLYNGYDAEWTLALIAPGSGSQKDALLLDELTDLVTTAVPEVRTAELASYALPHHRPEPFPAVICKFENTITEE